MPKALIVDDNEENLYLLESVLRGNGYEVVSAANGAEALTRARENPPDLIISDILMPVMDGFALCRKWHEDPQFKQIPFVFYTATYTDPKDERFALSLGADLFMIKPTEPDIFLEMIRGVLSRYQAGEIPSEPQESTAEHTYLREYNQILVNKLEKKLLELEEANRFNQAVMNAMTMHVAVLDEHGNVVDANDAWKRVAGERRLPEFTQAGVGTNVFDSCRDGSVRTSPETNEILAGIQCVLRGESDEFQAEFSSHTPEGERWYLMRVTPLGQPPSGAVMACFEVTRRVRAELERGEIAARFQGLFNAVTDAIHLYEMGDDGLPERLLEVNDAACTMLGYSRKEVLQLPFAKMRRLLGLDSGIDWKAIRSGHCISLEQILVATDGQEIPVEFEAYVMESQGRRVVFTLSHDLRARKQTEAERRRLEEQLRQAQKMEAVGQLAGGVAHDFNNLLQAISGYLELARLELPEDSPTSNNLAEVGKAVDRATSLVRQLLTFSRRETIQPEWVNLNTLIADLLAMIRRLIGEHIELEFVPGADLHGLRMDRGQIEQVLLNLCLNSRDAMPGGGHLLIETQNVDVDDDYCRTNSAAANGQYVVLIVSDTGIGIPASIQDRVFEPFFTTKGPGEGTGLGLATVYAIAQRSGGFLNLYSEEGSGTTFRVHFAASTDTPPVSSTLLKGDAGTCHGHGELVLLAEDDAQVRDLAVRMLERANYRVLVAQNGEEAIQCFEKHRDEIDVALLDMMMPKKTGRIVYETLREQGVQIPVLLASGYSFPLNETGHLSEEGCYLIRKPYRRSELLVKLQEVLGHTRCQ